jgi:hypothetical protein
MRDIGFYFLKAVHKEMVQGFFLFCYRATASGILLGAVA